MKSTNRETLTTRIVEALPVPERETVLWDRELSGFGVRVHPSGSKVYMVHKRINGKSRRVTIGSHEVWSLDDARREAGDGHRKPQGRADTEPSGCRLRLY